MAADDDLLSLGPWPLGVNNRLPDHRVPEGAARAAKDVTIRADGSIILRDGFTSKDSTAMHSLWPQEDMPGIDFALGVRGTALVKITVSASGTLSFTTLRTGMAGKDWPVSYVYLDGTVYYTNGIVTGRYIVDLASHRAWGIDLPPAPTVSATSTGGMYAGRYQVFLTYVNDLDEEGGASPYALVDVPAGGGISVTNLPTPSQADIQSIRIYLTEANSGHGDSLTAKTNAYRAKTLPVGSTSTSLAASASRGKRLTSQFLQPPPAAQLIEVHNGRIYGATGPLVWWTQGGSPLLYEPMQQFAFEADVDMLLSVNAGLFVAADRTFFLPGPPADHLLTERNDVFPYGAKRGARMHNPDDPGVMWMSHKGLCVGGPDGSAVNVTQAQVAVKEGAGVGAMTYHESDGVKQAITVCRGADSEMQADSYFGVSVINQKSFESVGNLTAAFSAEVINP